VYIIYYKNTSINAIVERTTETLGRILLTFDVSFSNTSTLLTTSFNLVITMIF